MAHNIYFNEHTGKHSFYSVKERAWHELGHISDQYETSLQVLENSGLNFNVNKEPNTHKFPDGTERQSDTSFFTYREDTMEILGDHVGLDYHVVQNVAAFEFFDAIAGIEGIYYETAGALGKGERIFITAKLPGYIRVGKDDLIEKYLFLTTSHDGKSSITAAFTPIRIVCNNTLNAALVDCENLITIKHTVNASVQLKQAHKIMGMVNTLLPVLETTFNLWANTPVSDEQMRKIILLSLVPNKETLDKIKKGAEDETSTVFKNMVTEVVGYALISETQQMDTTRGTLFGVYNAITGYFQNVRTYKDSDAKIKSLIYSGTAQTRAQTCFRLCEQFAKHGDSALQF
jgi:phage/plasmid-like protein (TIGR03299 family)